MHKKRTNIVESVKTLISRGSRVIFHISYSCQHRATDLVINKIFHFTFHREKHAPFHAVIFTSLSYYNLQTGKLAKYSL